MPNPRPAGVALALLVLLATLILSPSPVYSATSFPDNGDPLLFRCEQPSYVVSSTQPAVINLYADNAASLYGLDVRMTFDPSIALVADKGPEAGAQIEPQSDWFVAGFVARNLACNQAGGAECPAAGTITYVATQLNPQPPVPVSAPSGSFARITFVPQTAGTFELGFAAHMAGDIDGGLIPSSSQGCTIQFIAPTGVDLLHQSAESVGGIVRVNWETASEHNLVGFNVYRSTSAAGPWGKLTAQPLLAFSPGQAKGHAYSWDDLTVGQGGRYWYLVEEISARGSLARHGPVPVQGGQQPNAVRIAALRAAPDSGLQARPLSAVLILLALAMLAAAVKTRLRKGPSRGNGKPA